MEPDSTIQKLKNEIRVLKNQLIEKPINQDYTLFFENNEAVILIVDPSTQIIISVNDSAVDFYGYSRTEFQKMKISDINTMSQNEIIETMAFAKKTNQNHFVFKHKLASGEIRDVEVYQTKLSLDKREVFSVIVFDITHSNLAKKALAISEKRYRDFFEKDISGIYRSTPDGKLLDCNNAFAKMLGYSFDDLKSINTSSLYPTKGNREAFINKIKKEKYLFNKEIDLITKNGLLIHCIENVVGEFDKDGNLETFQGYILNITKRKQAELALEDSAFRFKQLSSITLEGIIIHDNGLAKDINQAFTNIFGYTKEDLIGINTIDLLVPEEYRKVVFENINDFHTKAYEIKGLKKDGTLIPIEIESRTIKQKGLESIRVTSIRDLSEKKKSELELQKSEARFKRLFEDLGDAVYVTIAEGDNMGQILEANSAAVRHTGYSLEELLNMNIIYDLYIKGTSSVSTEELNKQLKNGQLISATEKKRRKDGTEYWTEVIITPIDFGGEKASLSINHDITNRINSEIALKASEEKFRELFEKSGDPFLIINNRKFTDCNSAAVKLLGYTEKIVFLNEHPSTLSPHTQPDGRSSIQKADEMMDMCIEKGTHRFEWVHKKCTGEEFPVEVLLTAISSDPNNEIIHTVWRDITNSNKNKEKLQRSEQKFRELFEKSGDSIFILENGGFIDCNQTTIDLFGYDTKDELLNVHPSYISPKIQSDGRLSKTKADEMINISLKQGTHRFEWDHMKKNGDVFPVEVLLTAISSDEHKTVVHAVCRDITKKRNAKFELINAKEQAEESDRLKSAFLANMSHEIRTPMNGILGFASLLKLPDLNRDQQIDYVSIIEKSGQRMLTIINDLMDISKIESGQMEVSNDYTNVNEQIKQLFAFFKPETEKVNLGLEFSCALPDKESITYTDTEKLYAIIANLIKNSIKYSETGIINFGYYKQDKELVFYVKDTGIGIPKSRHNAIFQRFVQADIDDKKAKEGAGLGLAISKAYVEMLGGKIWLQSEHNIGTKFYFSIPYKPINKIIVEVTKSTTNAIPDELSEGKLNILIAEDEEYASAFLQIVVKNKANKILLASDGFEAIDICRNNPDLDLVLLDIKMPGLSGYKAAEEIRSFNKDIIIIAQTAYALPGDQEKALNAGCNDYISKPINKDELMSKIHVLFP